MYKRLINSSLCALRLTSGRIAPARFSQLKILVSQPLCSMKFVQMRYYSMVYQMGQTKVPQDLTKQKIEEKVLKAIKTWDRFPSDKSNKLSLETRFVEDLGFDSLDHVEIIMCIEDEFDLELSDDAAEKFKTPQDIVDFFCKRERIEE